ncbi:carboxypeptidase-like regulatory domain-containing protein [Mucilaginibacter sp.]|jgi:TonB-dependent SusC/RagA subfamily outer membrane receptor|uniref:carboxypeptidase-like regulatory domain-containing protein n=1 Tax=Mucilaginibacter sp. TaxID=1882438 RepID=UPI002B520DB2|nr:carboxypeptidase-like regulatory domain-containing protein [Mucilaginibacter sp.]HTI58058.1 carboxypeptidase-like regulatory domain-containing protein [Mucilaginibacter sp.]
MSRLCKKTTALLLFIAFIQGGLFAQQKLLTPSRQSSYYTFIYRLEPDEVMRFYGRADELLPEKMMHTLVDSFKTDERWRNYLPPGNYLKVYAEKNVLQYKLIENHTADLKLMHNTGDISFSLVNRQGERISNAVVHIKHKLIAFDSKSGLYHAKSSKKVKLIRVDYQGVVNFFTVAEQHRYRRNWLKAKWYGIKQLFRHKNNYSYNRYPNNYSDYYTGFMIFNKAIYRPGDTVKFKAFILDKKSKKPITVPRVLVRLTDRNNIDDVITGYVNSYRDGGYEGNVVLRDTLDLDLDEQYTISLEDPSSAKYGLDDDNTDSEDKAAMAKRRVFFAAQFKYEEYELKSVNFSTRLDKTEHWTGDPLVVYLKAVNENDLPVSDGRVTLTLTNPILKYNQSTKIFVPDTLWVHQVTLEPVGETKVLIPDSIFPKASLGYEIQAQFLNSNNESRSTQNQVTYNYERYRISGEIKGDTLVSSYFKLGKEIKGEAVISALSGEDTLSKTKVMLPSKIIINPNAVSYNIETDSTDMDVDLKESQSGISLSGYRTADSLFVRVTNERNLHLWYAAFAGTDLLETGEASTLFYRKAYSGSKDINFVVNYIWAGKSESEQTTVPYQDKLLNVYVKQPVTVYPGQRVRSEIAVTDQAGKPVANADITAWALTRKFTDYHTPFIPYLGKENYYRRTNRERYLEQNNNTTGMSHLDWKRWSREMGLDSIAYYQFTHPHPVYRSEEALHDTITQIAPFVMKNGDIEPVHILFIDERPVYFDQAQQMERYSFAVKPGKHNLKFRTTTQFIKLDSVQVDAYRKLIISLNDDTSNHAATFVKMADTLDRYEANFVDQHMVTITDNFNGKLALLQQGDQLALLNPVNTGYRNSNQVLVGPLAYNYADLLLPGEKPRSFLVEPDYSYLFEPGLLKQKSIPSRYPFRTALIFGQGATDYKQYVLTHSEADSIWDQYQYLKSNTQQLFINEPVTGRVTGRLEISVQDYKDHKGPLIKNIILYRYDDPDFIQVHSGNTTRFSPLRPGKYRILFLLKGDSYDIKDDVVVKAFGVTMYKFDVLPTHARDSVSIKINRVMANRTSAYKAGDSDVQNDALKLKEAFNDQYFDMTNFGDSMSGTVIGSDDKQPIIGCMIKVKGTNHGVVSDVNGHFRLKAPSSGKLIVSYIGYVTQEIRIEPGRQVTISLTPASNQLNEVVVTGYATVRKKDIAYSMAVVTTTEQGLMGQAAGVMIEGQPGGGSTIYIRGISDKSGAKPLIVVDGEIVADLNSISPADIGEISMLKDAAATALYGSQAANGVIVINTKKKSKAGQGADTTRQGEGSQSLRKNFSDYAYWQPKLTTDAEGKASFVSIFPDDITNWRTFVVAINGQKQTGFSEKQIKSYRPVSANFVSPQFAVRGDELHVIGKVLNYTADTIKVERGFAFNGKPITHDLLQIKNSHIDTMSVTAGGADSLAFEYTIKRDNGYFDGERRKIPLMEQGTKETKGVFEALEKDTTVSLKFDPALGSVTFHAESSVLPALLEESDKLRNYQYLCNEQLASKLIGLLSERRIKKFLNEPFEHGRNITEIIKKIQQNRNSQGIWGWWKDTPEELWVSLHVIDALLDAENDGYQTGLDKVKLTQYLLYQLDSYKERDRLNCLELLKKLGAKADYEKYVAIISKEISLQKTPSEYNKMRLMRIKQQADLPVKMDSLLAKELHTMFGNIYWGEESYRFFDNSVQLSVLAYQIIKNDGKHPEVLAKIRGYFMEQRKGGDWRNTYESALILENILPDLLTADKEIKPASITLSGAKEETIIKFPYTATFTTNDLKITKTGTLPVYITGYQQFWNRKPEKVSKDFTVNSWFEKKGDKLTKLKGGEAVELKAEVTARGDADYVMINIPIPAGCSYESKEQNWGNEVHREYFKDRVSIFCRSLKQGTYTFTINLMPRYSGIYNINPAKAEMMYFPVFYGREGMKKVAVGD